ncbi:MAG: hypothetical protein ACNA8R_00235 [Nitriliruptoraceae bacterium]
MSRRLGSWLLATFLTAGVVAIVRQRWEAQAVRRGTLPRASAAAALVPRRPHPAWAEQLAGWVPTRPATPLGRLVATVWAGPLTVVGFGLAALAGAHPRWDVDLGCFVARGVGGPSRVALRAVGASANTVGLVVLSPGPRPDPVLLAHEAVHARQAERLGPLLLPAYVLLSARFGYRDNPLEQAARLGARRALPGRPH